MDKTRKLRRYKRKDYTQVVDFPVEIVGRDGVVRRYSFESSVRLYQRRIASAPGRYRDPELVEAEAAHCRHRIKQLRASYLRRHGFSDLGAQALDIGDLAGEVAAFLRRCFGAQAQSLSLQPLDEQAWGQAWYLQQPETGVAYLVSLYPFEHFGSCPGREAFFETLRVLRVAQGAQVEALVAFHHSGDCGLVLTCQGAHAKIPLGEESPERLSEDPEGGPWTDGLRALGEEDLSAALACFEEAQLQRPFARRIAVACGSVADMIGAFANAETAARIGLSAFPKDPVLHYQLALAQLRVGELRQAEASLARCPQTQRLPQAELLKALIALRQGRLFSARGLLAKAARNHRVHDLASWMGGLRARIWALMLFALGCLGAVVFAALSFYQGAALVGLAAACASLLSLTGAALAWWSLRVRVSDEVLSSLRLPPAEAIGASGPHLGDLVD